MARLVQPTYYSLRDFAMILLMTLAMLREANAVALKSDDVWIERADGQSCIFIFVEMSKTDQCRNGHTIVLGETPSSAICPVRWISLFVRFRDSLPVFFTVHYGSW